MHPPLRDVFVWKEFMADVLDTPQVRPSLAMRLCGPAFVLCPWRRIPASQRTKNLTNRPAAYQLCGPPTSVQMLDISVVALRAIKRHISYVPFTAFCVLDPEMEGSRVSKQIIFQICFYIL